MIETGIVLAVVALLAALGVLLPLLPAELIVDAGTAVIVVGAALGLPTGFWYHVRLRAALLQSDRLPARWWLRPVALHGRLSAEDRGRVMRWFYAGGLGFVAIVLGCVAIVAGVLLEARRVGAL